MIWAAGQQLQQGKFTIQEVIRVGRLSVTYLAKTAAGELVVIKAPNDAAMQRSDFERLQQIFMQEAVKLAKCHHPHIVQVEYPFLEQGICCISMEYIAGTTLAKRDRPILPEVEAVKYVRQIGEALTVVHQNDLLHRDVTPANIMLRVRDGVSEAVLIDFGLAREFDHDLTQTRTEEITPGYTPLELYSRQQQRGAFTDLYSLGATLYNLITGKVPPSAEARQLNNARLEIPTTISRPVKRSIEWAMQLKAGNRPQSVQEWLQDLPQPDSLTNSTPESHPKPVPSQRVNWTVFWTAVAAIGTLLTGLAVIPELLKEFRPAPAATSSPNQTSTP